jgi:hypothetical protein
MVAPKPGMQVYLVIMQQLPSIRAKKSMDYFAAEAVIQ